MKILVRLPNWLGDMVMSVGFVRQLPHFFPGAEISVIAKKGIHELLPFFPPLEHRFVFSKHEYPGMKGLIRFGNAIREKANFELFFCLPDSFSAAIMGAATGANRRIGYKKELRQVLLTDSFARPEGMHRVDEYIRLLELFTGREAAPVQVKLEHALPRLDQIVVNINSEASSRRLTLTKAVDLVSNLRAAGNEKIFLVGAPKERELVEEVLFHLPDKSAVESKAGKTTLEELCRLLASSRLMLTTDSGPAHLANALGTHTVVLFGAGDEKNTAPYNHEYRTIIRLGKLDCEPCRKNVCIRYGTPQCLEQLDTHMIIQTTQLQLNGQGSF